MLPSGRLNYQTRDQCRAFEAAWDAYHPGGRSMAMANGSLTMEGDFTRRQSAQRLAQLPNAGRVAWVQ